ncbi:MAG: CBS domain-containing protein [Gemmataceae bacterium]
MYVAGGPTHRPEDHQRSQSDSTEVIVCRPETTIEEVRGSMCHRRIRHLPVLDRDNKLIGMISIGDLNTLLAMDQEQTIHLLQEYMFGRV